MKKNALALEAEIRLKGTGWVPSIIRMQEVKPAKKASKAKVENTAKA